tara:strand:+ start:535 stop:1275 length:741 start_codon:yes stop_codon:yes gene_type:complete
MQFYGFYNAFGGGTEIVTAGSNENVPSARDTISQNKDILFNGQFTNLSRVLIHIGLFAFRPDGSTVLHKHDIRAYESLNVHNVPLRSIEVFVPVGKTVGFHGMGCLTKVESEDELAVALTKTGLDEDLHNSPDFELDQFKSATITTATDTTLWTPASDSCIGVYKINMAVAGAQTIELKFTDSVGSVPSEAIIGLYRFGSEGTYTMDFDTALLRNPNGNDGLLLATTTTTASTEIDCIGHDILVSQ